MSKANIMVVEDEGVVALELQECLEEMGYNVPATAANATEAVKMAIETNPDLLLMDINLNDKIDGIEAAKNILERSNIPIIYLTAYSEETTLQRAKETAPYGYILKPFETRNLDITIQMALRKAKVERDIRENRNWLNTILSNMETAILVFDNEEKLRFANYTAELLLRFRFDHLRKESCNNLLKLVDPDTNKPIILTLYHDDIDAMRMEIAHCLLIGKDDSEISIKLVSEPLLDAAKSVVGTMVLITEIGSNDPNIMGDSWLSDGADFVGVGELAAPVLQDKGSLQTYLEVEIVRLMMELEQPTEFMNDFLKGQYEAYKHIYDYYFGQNPMFETN